MNLSALLQANPTMDIPAKDDVVSLMSALDKWQEMIVNYLPKLVVAIIIFLIGSWLIKITVKVFVSGLKRKNIDSSLETFLSSLVKIGLLVLLLITIISILGVNITSFAALLAGAGLAIGGALNGSLGNFAGGVMILILKPFKVGDMIEAQTHFGIVTEIGIIYTTLLTAQNKTIRIPNGILSTEVINNYTDQDTLRIDIKVPVADYTDFSKASQIAKDAMMTISAVLREPEPAVNIAKISDDGPVLVLCPYIKVKPFDPANPRQMEKDYYSVSSGVRRAVYEAFMANDIDWPSSSHEIYMVNKK
jgi:small conductance mechanosensitive channel